MHSVLRLFDQICTCELWKVGKSGQSQEAQRSVGNHPGRNVYAVLILNHDVAVLVVVPQDGPECL